MITKKAEFQFTTTNIILTVVGIIVFLTLLVYFSKESFNILDWIW